MNDLFLRAWLGAINLRDRVFRRRNEEGAVALEYLLIIGLVVILLFAILWLFMDPIKNMVNNALKKIDNWLTSTNNAAP